VPFRVERDGETVTIQAPIRTSNPANCSQGITRAWRMARVREARDRKDRARALVLAARPLPPLPVVVTVTRESPRKLDAWDGLGGALKQVIDGTTQALGLASDDDPRVAWHVAQRKAKSVGVVIRIESLADARRRRREELLEELAALDEAVGGARA
jgi:hypothetical protein